MSDNYQTAIEICQAIIGRKASVTDNEINDAVAKATMIYSAVDAEKLKNDLLSMYSVKIDTFQILEGKERREPWLKDFNANKKSNWEFWTRYAEYLEKQKKFSPTHNDLIFSYQRKGLLLDKCSREKLPTIQA